MYGRGIKHVAIIMDGNGRWARSRGHARFYGHVKGVQTARSIVLAAKDAGIPFITLYTFSYENWARPKHETNILMQLIQRHFGRDREFLRREDIRVRIMGKLDDPRISDQMRQQMHQVEISTEQHEGIQVNLAISYSSRYEIMQAAAKLASEKEIESWDEETFRKYLYLPEVPDPDLVIRTSGEHRLSNFLLWQAAYSEFYFSPIFWPDFTPSDFREALVWYSKRVRKYGNVEPCVTP